MVFLVCLQFAEQPPASETIAEGAKELAATGVVVAKDNASISLRGDRDAQLLRYELRGSRAATLEALRAIAVTNRVKLIYRQIGDSRELVSAIRLGPVAKTTITGEVVCNHGWWIEVKPDRGPCEGYAVRAQANKNSEVTRYVAGLRQFDIVTIRFSTNATGHRIDSIWKTGTARRERQTTRMESSILSSCRPGGAHVAFTDGRVRFLSDKIDPKVLQATAIGGENVPDDGTW